MENVNSYKTPQEKEFENAKIEYATSKEKNTELTKTAANNLRKEVQQQKAREVEKLSNGNIRIPYDREGAKRNFDIDPQNSRVIVRKYTYLESIGKEAWQIQENKTINITSLESLNQEMHDILNEYIEENRVAIPGKVKEARKLIESSTEAYTEKDFERNEKKQALSYTYILGNKGANVTMKKVNESILITINVHNDFGPGKSTIKKTVPTKDIEKIPNTIYEEFAKGIDLKTLGMIVNNDYTPNTDLLQKIKQKAETGVNILKKKIETK